MNDRIILGLDEAGRGPLAGPVTAGAVILPVDFPFELLNDSKKLSEKKREAAFEIITKKALWGIGIVDHEEIDRINILKASLLAMKKAFENLMDKKNEWQKENENFFSDDKRILAIADGIYCPEVSCECVCEIKADGKYPEVMAASIIAKVTRDRMMMEYDRQYPQWGYAKHKGYPTPAHKKICREIGPSPIQRLTFRY